MSGHKVKEDFAVGLVKWVQGRVKAQTGTPLWTLPPPRAQPHLCHPSNDSREGPRLRDQTKDTTWGHSCNVLATFG